MAKTPVKKEVLQLGNITLTTKEDTPLRMALLLWGPATCGKTTFAATAPGRKLWLSFGDNEHVSVSSRGDVIVASLFDLGVDELFKDAQSDNPFNLDKFLAEHDDVETVVVDSLTAITYRALQKAVKDGVGAGRGFRPTMEAPGISAYGGRNAIVLETLTGLLRITAKHGVHIIITAHEDDPVTRQENGKDIIDYITVQLGGKLVNNMSWRLSEIWYMSQEDQGKRRRRLAVRPTRLRRPMKTRLFRSDQGQEFFLDYNSEKPDKGQMTIANWVNEWMEKQGEKINVPEA